MGELSRTYQRALTSTQLPNVQRRVNTPRVKARQFPPLTANSLRSLGSLGSVGVDARSLGPVGFDVLVDFVDEEQLS